MYSEAKKALVSIANEGMKASFWFEEGLDLFAPTPSDFFVVGMGKSLTRKKKKSFLVIGKLLYSVK